MSISDRITFEVSQEESATELCRRLERPHSQVEAKAEFWAVQVRLPASQEAVAMLLRDVEAWVAEEGLGAIRFRFDGRDYVMEAGEVAWTLEAA